VLFLVGNSILDRLELSDDPGILSVAVGVELGESLETLLGVSVGKKPLLYVRGMSYFTETRYVLWEIQGRTE
jgi:hypothetical protein